MTGVKILLIFIGVGVCFGAEEAQRGSRTIARFFGLDSNGGSQQQGQQPGQAQPSLRRPAPLIYSVKYYDRTGEGEKVEVIQDPVVQDRVQPVPARVFLNLYTGQQTPVYYDNKGQLLVPCPVYDHLYVSGYDPVTRKQVQTKGQNQQTQALPPVVPPIVPLPQPVPEVVYYATPQYQPKQGAQVAVVGAPYEYGYYPGGGYPFGGYPFGAQGYNPYVYLKPPVVASSHLHHHVEGVPNGSSVQQQVPQASTVVEKKEGEKSD